MAFTYARADVRRSSERSSRARMDIIIVKAGEPPLLCGDPLRIKAALAGTRAFDLDRAGVRGHGFAALCAHQTRKSRKPRRAQQR